MHDIVLMLIIFITILVIYILSTLIKNIISNRSTKKRNLIEIIWTLFPIIILLVVAIPSVKILYTIDCTPPPKITIKCIGHQWFWRYEYTEFKNVQFDSFIVPTCSLEINEFRLLDVDNRCVLPFQIQVRVLSTSIDVIHAWTVPSLGIKIDSTPGRLNQFSLIIIRPGIYFGQCSEICGTNHRFMPIAVESTRFKDFIKWILSFPIL